MNRRGNIVKGWKKLIFSVILSLFFFGDIEVLAEEVFEAENEKEVFVEEVKYSEEGLEEILETESFEANLDLEEKVESDEDVLVEEESTDEESTNEEEIFDENDTVLVFDKEAVFTEYSSNMYFEKDTVTIMIGIEKDWTVFSILELINIDELNNTYGVEAIMITDEEDILMNDTDLVRNLCHIVFIGSNFVSRYQVQFMGDINQDNQINEEDIQVGIDTFLGNSVEVNQESSLTEEISYADAVVEKNTYEVSVPVDEDLCGNMVLATDSEFYVEDKVVVQYSIEGMNFDYFNTISGYVQYDEEVLLLENIYVLVDGKVIGGVYHDQFIYVLDNYRGEDYFLVMVFQGIKSGNSLISLENLQVVMNGTLLEVNNCDNLEVFILDYGKGGDVWDNSNITENSPIIEPSYEDKKAVVLKPTVYEEKTESNQIVTTVILSNDNYIESLEIKGYSIDFNKDISRYSIEVDSNVLSLDLNVLLSHDNSAYFITGNEDFKEGKNEIILTVFAEDGSSRDYVIEVNKKEGLKEVDEEVTNKETELKKITLLIILVILIITIVWIIYRLLREAD